MKTQTKPQTPKNPGSALCLRLADLRSRLDLSPAQMADYLGVPIHTLRKWLTGEREPGAAVARLLEVMGLLEALAPNLHQTFLVNLAPRVKQGRRATPSPADNPVMSENPLTESQP